MPRACLVEIHVGCYHSRLRASERVSVKLHETSSWHLEEGCRVVATSVKLHDARSWHLEEGCHDCSGYREGPRRKVVASDKNCFNVIWFDLEWRALEQ
jgi:hypothetical protein